MGGIFKAIIISAILSLAPIAFANSSAQPGTWRTADFDGLSYRLLLPPDFDQRNTYPLILFLHGSGQDLNDDQPVPATANAFVNTAEFRARYSAIIVAPQCPGSSDYKKCNWGAINADSGSQEDKAVQLVQAVERAYHVDSQRVYVTGFSLGGIGAWDMIIRFNQLFTAALPISGGSYHSSDCQETNLLHTPVWAVHGSDDNIVPPTDDRKMYACLNALGGKLMNYTEYQGVGHDAWTRAYGDDTYFAWLFSQRR